MNDEHHYPHKDVEEKWRKAWEKFKLDTPDILQATKPFYNLMMFPYPSAEGLHVGNMYAFTGADIYGRFKRMQGKDVFEPIGLDGFGIHSENYAFKIGKHPMDQAAISQKRFYNQLHTIGAMYDWTRTVETYDPDYYRWTQWLFVQMFKHGLAYRGKAQVNWCPGCKTVLADEQVVARKATILRSEATKDLKEQDVCERCGNKVEKRQLEQWFFKITAYAEKLLENSYRLDWSQKVKLAQQQWIGKKTGINITYPVVDGSGKQVGEITCFTTRPDTNFGATFVAIAPEHPFALKLLKEVPYEIARYLDRTKKGSKDDRVAAGRKKTGVFTGLYCVNQLNSYKMPLYVSDFVLMEFGTGAVVGVPGHDKRDFEFAQAMKLPVVRVVVEIDGNTSTITKVEQVQEESGTMINSGFLDGVETHEAIPKMMDYIEKKGWGKRVVTYHLRDWLISRQRYWGPPIPMIYCEKCGWYPVPEDQLPVILPRIDDYKPGDDPDVTSGPLAKHKEFYQTSCPKCGGKAVRETDVSDTFLDSSWYFLRYPSVSPVIASEAMYQTVHGEAKQSPANAGLDAHSGEIATPSTPRKDKQTLPWDPSVTKKWLPVHTYTGGAEHSVLHLLYSRFITMALHDMGYIEFEEPFTTFYAHGLVIKDGAKMSKSKGNVVNPDEYIARYGADALRLYLMFTGTYDQGGDFRDSGMEGMARWVQRVWRLATRSIEAFSPRSPISRLSPRSLLIKKALHRTIKKVGEDTQRRRYNTCVAAMMELVNAVIAQGGVMAPDDLKDFLKILAPFAPYMTEELWQRIHRRVAALTKSNSIHFQPWPAYDLKLLEEDTVEIIVQVNGKLRDTISVKREASSVREDIEKTARAGVRVAKRLEGENIKKIIFVPGRLINFVT